MAQQGWFIDTVGDLIVFVNAPANGAPIVVRKYDTTAYNATPIWAFGAWSNTYGWPREVEYYSDRIVFACNTAQPQTLWFSKVGDYNNFGRNTPLEDSDAITVTINARQINTIRDLVPVDNLLVLTSGGEWKTTGGTNDVLTPSTIGFKPQSMWGVSDVPTTVVGNTAVFIQDRGSVVRDLAYEFSADGYVGNNLSIFSQHLLEGHSIVDVAFQQVPFNVVWAVRDDGALLSMTYVKEQQIIGWARHDTRGLVESICCIPEGTEDALYMVVRRKIGANWQRYIERVESRLQPDPLRPWFVDAGLIYDGRNTTGGTIVISPLGGPNAWAETDDLFVQAVPPLSPFAGMTVGDAILVEATSTAYDAEVGAEVTTVTATARLRIVALGLNANSVRVRSVGTLPEVFRGAPIERYTLMVDTFSGLDHLEGFEVTGTGDGDVLPRRVVDSGAVSFGQPYGVVVLGLPYLSDVQTLEVNVLGGESVRANQKIMSKVTVVVDTSRNVKVGRSPDRLTEVKVRRVDENYADPLLPSSEAYVADITDGWSKNGRVFIRQDMPLPLTLLSVIPTVHIASVSGGS